MHHRPLLVVRSPRFVVSRSVIMIGNILANAPFHRFKNFQKNAKKSLPVADGFR